MNLHDSSSFHTTRLTPFGSLQKDKTERQKAKIGNSFVLYQTPYFVGYSLSLLMKKTKRQLKKVYKSLEKNARFGVEKVLSFFEQCCFQPLSFCHNILKSISYAEFPVLLFCLFARFVILSSFKNGEQA